MSDFLESLNCTTGWIFDGEGYSKEYNPPMTKIFKSEHVRLSTIWYFPSSIRRSFEFTKTGLIVLSPDALCVITTPDKSTKFVSGQFTVIDGEFTLDATTGMYIIQDFSSPGEIKGTLTKGHISLPKLDKLELTELVYSPNALTGEMLDEYFSKELQNGKNWQMIDNNFHRMVSLSGSKYQLVEKIGEHIDPSGMGIVSMYTHGGDRYIKDSNFVMIVDGTWNLSYSETRGMIIKKGDVLHIVGQVKFHLTFGKGILHIIPTQPENDFEHINYYDQPKNSGLLSWMSSYFT